MSNRTIYQCDRCGKESEERDFIQRVASGVLSFPPRNGTTVLHFWTGTVREADWCEECRVACGMFSSAELEKFKKKGIPIEDSPSLEIQLAEIIRTIAHDAGYEGAKEAMNDH